MDLDGKTRTERERDGQGLFQDLGNGYPLHAPLHQPSVAHQIGDDPIGAGHFFTDDGDLLGDGLPLTDRLLQRVGGVVNDPERILQLMSDLGGQTAGGFQLLLLQ